MNNAQIVALADWLAEHDSHTIYDVNETFLKGLPDAVLTSGGEKLEYGGKTVHLPIESGASIVNQMHNDPRGGTYEETLVDSPVVVVGYRLAASVVSQIVPRTQPELETAQRMMGRGSAHRAYIAALRAYASEQV
jgi:hypothetical protein